jgi:ubiquinone/menaquinone biosynthesis C-methylase UbiE
VLTVRFDRLGLRPGSVFLDAGAGFGRHAFEAARRGATVYALDWAQEEVTGTRNTFGAMIEAGEIPESTYGGSLRGDARRLPCADGTFDAVVTSEVHGNLRAAQGAEAGRHARRHGAHVVAREDQLDAVG